MFQKPIPMDILDTELSDTRWYDYNAYWNYPIPVSVWIFNSQVSRHSQHPGPESSQWEAGECSLWFSLTSKTSVPSSTDFQTIPPPHLALRNMTNKLEYSPKPWSSGLERCNLPAILITNLSSTLARVTGVPAVFSINIKQRKSNFLTRCSPRVCSF